MFGTSGIRGPIADTITADLALAIGRALGTDTATVVIGRDTRTTGAYLADAVSAGLRECGTDVIRLGIAPTPTIARSVAWKHADAGVVITASHNPPSDNGFKLWQPTGQAFDEAAQEPIETRIQSQSYDYSTWDATGRETTWSESIDTHKDTVITTTSPSDLSVVIDIGNGTGSITASILQELGCHVETLNAQPDGRFPGRPSEPTAANCQSLCDYVATTEADLGIAHDGDADRTLAVTEDGSWIAGDILLALFARETASPGDVIAAPINTSLAVDDFLDETDVTVTRTPVGDVFVAAATTGDDVVFGGEPSGAWIWPDQTLCPDGPLAAAKLVELVTTHGSLAQLSSEIETYPIHRTAVETAKKDAVMTIVRGNLEDRYDTTALDTRDGCRVDLGDAWFLIRPSGTQPLIRVTAEARATDRARDVYDDACNLVQTAVIDHE